MVKLRVFTWSWALLLTEKNKKMKVICVCDASRHHFVPNRLRAAVLLHVVV